MNPDTEARNHMLDASRILTKGAKEESLIDCVKSLQEAAQHLRLANWTLIRLNAQTPKKAVKGENGCSKSS